MSNNAKNLHVILLRGHERHYSRGISGYPGNCRKRYAVRSESDSRYDCNCGNSCYACKVRSPKADLVKLHKILRQNLACHQIKWNNIPPGGR